MKRLKLLPLAMIIFFACKKSSIDPSTPPPEENPPTSATPIIKEYSGYLGMRSNAVFLSSDNQVLICGSDSTPDGASNGKLKVIKATKSGAIAWEKTYKIGGQSWASSITELNGSYYVTGKVWTTAFYCKDRHRVFLTKLSNNGDSLWTKYFTINHCDQHDTRIIKTKDNNLVIAGDVEAGNGHIFAMKLTSDGDSLWSNIYTIGNEETLKSITENANGELLITGQYTDNTHSYYNTFFLKLNASGVKLWDRKTDLETYTYDGLELPDGSIISTGYTVGAIYGWIQAYLVKFDNMGNQLWIRDFGHNDTNEIGHCVKYNANNTITMGGTSENKFYVINTDMNGNVLWEKKFGPVTGLKNDEMSMVGDQLHNNLLFGFNTVLVQVKPLPAPAEYVSTIYYSKVDKDGNFF